MADYMKRGIDISYCQTKVDWAKVDADFVIMRAGYGKYAKQKDVMFESHYAGALSRGIPCGAYWYSYALNENDAIQEAKVFLEIIKNKRFAYPVIYDVEENNQFALGKQAVSKIIRAFLSTVESAGYWVGLYMSRAQLNAYVEDDIKNRYTIWLAEWGVKQPTYKGQYGLWQYGVGKASGVSGDCDLDYCYVDYPTLIKQKGLNGFSNTDNTPTTPVEPEKPVEPTTPTNDDNFTFVPRLKIPEKGNPYYNRKVSGGYSDAIQGKPTYAGLDVLANCSGYAFGRFNEIIGENSCNYLRPVNGEDYVDIAISQGLTVSQKPSLGACMCWSKGKTHTSSDGCGHVAIVEVINADGSIVTSESGYNCSTPFWTQKRVKGNGNWGAGNGYTFLGFIENPKVKPPKKKENRAPYNVPTKPVREGDTGNDVKWLQWYLTDLKYYIGEIDGKFGIITLGALLAYQFKNGLEVDGVCGPGTRQSLLNT